MNRNGKIALGCGGAGCLFLFVGLFVVGVLIYTGVILAPGVYSPNRNSDSSYNYNRNSNVDITLNSNSNESPASSSSLPDDDKHKLFQAAAGTGDQILMRRVWVKLDLVKTSGGLSDDYTTFAKDHIAWAIRNQDFMASVNTPEKARAYVEQHFDD